MASGRWRSRNELRVLCRHGWFCPSCNRSHGAPPGLGILTPPSTVYGPRQSRKGKDRTMAQITFYLFSTVSPYTYLAGTRMERWRPPMALPSPTKPRTRLAAVFPAPAHPGAERPAARLELRAQELRRQAKKHVFAIRPRPAVPRGECRASSLCLHRGMRAGGGDPRALVQCVHRPPSGADRRDIAHDDVDRRSVWQAAGFDRGAGWEWRMLAGGRRIPVATPIMPCWPAIFRRALLHPSTTPRNFWGQGQIDGSGPCFTPRTC